MPFDHLFPNFPRERIVYEDDDVIVIDKPVDVSTHAPDLGRTDDAYSRLREAIADRDSVTVDDVYLGIHQRLDRDTSGVLLFTRRKSANAGVAAEFEGRHVKKTYLAVVDGWPGNLKEGVLRDELIPAEDGKMQVARPVERAAERRDVRTPANARFKDRGRSAGPGHAPRGKPSRGDVSRGKAPHGNMSRDSAPRGAPETTRHPKAQLAVTRYRLIKRVGSRALLEVS
ncbi:MAG: pseudouridine synthase, partial [Polyangiaceae bacterium]